ncbi:MAG: AraC family transcriptional regulator [Bacillota bacterium]|nr:AraC family transcriptional regulator [Bacillota bacterium]
MTIILIMLIVFSAILNYMININEKEISQSNQFMLDQFARKIDNHFIVFAELAKGLSSQNQITKLKSITDKISAQNRYDMSEAIELLNGYKLSNRSIKNIFIYLSKADMIITNNSVLNKDLFVRIRDSASVLEKSLWEEMLSSEYSSKVLPIHGTNSLFYCQTIFLNYYDSNLVNMIIEVDFDYIYDEIKDDISSDIVGFRIDDGISSVGSYSVDHDINFVGSLLSDYDAASGKIEFNGEEYFTSSRKSEYYDAEYIIYISYIQYTKGLILLNRTVNISILTLVSLGIIMVLAFSLIDYYPIKNLMKKLNKYSGYSNENNDNELAFIDNMFDKISSENEIMLSTKKQVNEQYQNNIISNLVSGRTIINFQKDDLLNSQHSVLFPNPYFIFITINLDISNSGYYDHEIIAMINNEFKGKCDEMSINIRCLTIDDNIVCLFNIPLNSIASFKDCLLIVSRKLVIKIENCIQHSVYLFVGQECMTFEQIAEQYRRSTHFENYKFITTRDDHTIFFDDIRMTERNKSTDYIFSFDEEVKLINLVMNGEAQKAQELINKIYEHIINHGTSASITKCLIYDIVASIVKVYQQASERFNVSTDSKYRKAIDDLIYAKDIKKFFQLANNIIDVIVKDIVQKSDDSDIVRKAKMIINNVYSNPSINCNAIADMLSVNASYLSHVFKKNSGENLLYYMNECRIRKAEELIVDNDCNLNEVAKRTGFTSDITLSRVYKKHRGITPGDFRKFKESS